MNESTLEEEKECLNLQKPLLYHQLNMKSWLHSHFSLHMQVPRKKSMATACEHQSLSQYHKWKLSQAAHDFSGRSGVKDEEGKLRL